MTPWGDGRGRRSGLRRPEASVRPGQTLREFRDANPLLGDAPRLQAEFDQSGYLYFRDVLDAATVGALYGSLLAALRDAGLVAPDCAMPVWNGMALENFTEKVKSLEAAEPWRAFRDEADMEGWLQRTLGGEYRCLPLCSYRMAPPSTDPPQRGPAAARFKRIHQDGYYNRGLRFLICWVPLMHIPPDVGGVAVAEGWHRELLPHASSGPTMFSIASDVIPEEAWVSTHFRPGDLLVMRETTPHTAIVNRSNRFRLSFDFRLSAAPSELPILGRVVSIDCDRLVLATAEGDTVTLVIDGETLCPSRRGIALQHGGWIPQPGIAEHFSVGQQVLATYRHGRARLLRRFDIGLGA